MDWQPGSLLIRKRPGRRFATRNMQAIENASCWEFDTVEARKFESPRADHSFQSFAVVAVLLMESNSRFDSRTSLASTAS
jgi:hypothetical protein